MKIKIDFSLSGYAGGESDLISLKNPVPNGDFTYYGMNPITHGPNERRLNPQSDVSFPRAKSGIKRRKKKKTEATVDLTKDGDASEAPPDGLGLGEPVNVDNPAKHTLPNGPDRYFGLDPLAHEPVTHMVMSAEFGSRFTLYAPVWFRLASGPIPASILAVTFMEGKVLYTLAVYTGFPSMPEQSDRYGQINSIGWDEQGNEYIRVNSVDSIFVEPRLETLAELILKNGVQNV